MKNTGTPMTGKTRRNMIMRIKQRMDAGTLNKDIGEGYVKKLLSSNHPGITKTMAYGFNPTK